MRPRGQRSGPSAGSIDPAPEGRNMELSVLPRPQLEPAPSDERCPAAPAAELAQFDVPVPTDLRQFGTSIRASALGNRRHPPVVVLGGISANRFPAIRPDGSPGWWWGLAGEGSAIDPVRHCIIGMDFAADESGNTAPSTFDQARVLAAALDAIGFNQPVSIVGASYGGMVGLALAEIEPQRIARLVVIGAADAPHPAATASRELQRRVVALGIEAGRGEEALAIARGMAMLTYRTPQEFAVRFDGGLDASFPASCSKAGGYLRARGQAFLSIMSPSRFLSLSASIDRHRVNPERITSPVILIGAESDQLLLAEQLT